MNRQWIELDGYETQATVDHTKSVEYWTYIDVDTDTVDIHFDDQKLSLDLSQLQEITTKAEVAVQAEEDRREVEREARRRQV